MFYIGTSKQTWISWTSPHWELLTDMPSKLSITSSGRVSGRSMEKETLTHIMKGKVRKDNLKRASPRCRQRRVTRSLRKTPESGVSSRTTLGTTLMNVAHYSHLWSRSKTKSRTPTWTLIQKIIKGDKSLMQNPLLLSQLQQSNNPIFM